MDINDVVIAFIGAVVAIFLAIIAYLFRLNDRINSVEKDVAIREAVVRDRQRRDGNLEHGSDWRLTEKGLALIPPQVKNEIDEVIEKKGYPRRYIRRFILRMDETDARRMIAEDIISMMGGVEKLLEDAETIGVDLEDYMLIVETYILNRLAEIE